MILFVFEGMKAEPMVFGSLERGCIKIPAHPFFISKQ